MWIAQKGGLEGLKGLKVLKVLNFLVNGGHLNVIWGGRFHRSRSCRRSRRQIKHHGPKNFQHIWTHIFSTICPKFHHFDKFLSLTCWNAFKVSRIVLPGMPGVQISFPGGAAGLDQPLEWYIYPCMLWWLYKLYTCGTLQEATYVEALELDLRTRFGSGPTDTVISFLQFMRFNSLWHCHN